MSSKVSPTECVHNTENKYMDTTGRRNAFLVNERGQQLYCGYWNPIESQPIRSLVYISHGFSEHLQWYEELAVKFANIGILAFGHDHVGHGKSDGFRGHITSFNEYSNDVVFHCQKIIKKHKGLPCFIVGHSMGGMVSIMAAMNQPDLFAGVVLMGPLLRPNPQEATPFKLLAAKVISTLFPYCPIAFLNEKHVTRDTEMRQKLHEDPLRYRGGIRAGWTMAYLEDYRSLIQHVEQVRWPFLVLHGENDLICDPEAAIEFYKKAASKDKEMKIFPGAYHNLYIEVPDIRRESIQETINWIKARL